MINKVIEQTVTPEWIRKQQEIKRVSNKLLAEGVNTSYTKISQWLHGANMSGPSKAAVYYYFKQLN